MRRVCLVQILAISVTQLPHLNMGVYRMAKTYIARCDILLALFPCVDLDRYCFLLWYLNGHKIKRVDCSITPPHHLCIFICRYKKLYYYCTLTYALILFFLSILTPISLFLLNPAHGGKSLLIYMHLLQSNIHLHPPEVYCIDSTSPLCNFRIYSHLLFFLRSICVLSRFLDSRIF